MVNEISAGVIVFRKEEDAVKYLLLHYQAGHWEYVKGHIEENEDEKTAAIRETEEETGITDLDILPDFKHTIKYFFRRKNQTISKKVHFYIAETKTKNVKLSDEHIGYEWLNYEKALERVSFKNSKIVLEKANEFIAKL